MKLNEYLKVAVRHTTNKKPTLLSSKKRVVYRTYTVSGGLSFVSKVHLGILASAINWSNNPHNRVYDWALVEDKNIFIEMAKTRAI